MVHKDISTVIKNLLCYIAVFYEHEKRHIFKKTQKTTPNYKTPVWVGFSYKTPQDFPTLSESI